MTDIYRQVIEQPESIPEELRKKIDFLTAIAWGASTGSSRITRGVGNLKPNLGAANSAELVQTAGQCERVEPADCTQAAAGAAGSLCGCGPEVMAPNPSPEARSHALWLLRPTPRWSRRTIPRARKSRRAHPRNALQMSEPLLGRSPKRSPTPAGDGCGSESRVRFQSALTIGDLKEAARWRRSPKWRMAGPPIRGSG